MVATKGTTMNATFQPAQGMTVKLRSQGPTVVATLIAKRGGRYWDAVDASGNAYEVGFKVFEIRDDVPIVDSWQVSKSAVQPPRVITESLMRSAKTLEAKSSRIVSC